MDGREIPECLSCGACCFSTNPRFVRVTGADHARLGVRAEDHTRFIGNRCFMKITGGKCASLRIDGRAERFYCDVYDVRPQICRDLARGSGQCLAELERKEPRVHRVLAQKRLARNHPR